MSSPGKKSFPLRIDPSLWAEVERLAAQELRSVNAQVECLLREALGKRGLRLKPPLPRGAAREDAEPARENSRDGELGDAPSDPR